MTKAKFVLSCISSGLLFWAVNHTFMYENFKLNAFKKIEFVDEISNNWPKGLLGTNVHETLKSCW